MKKLGLLLTAGFAVAMLTACPGTKYEITWKDWDDSVLRVDSVSSGATPDYGKVPTREADEKYNYAFLTWSPDVVEATENASYTAVYSKTEKETKADWTNEEKEIMAKYLDEPVPFYKAAFEVSEPAEEDCVILVSGRHCGEEDIEEFEAVLEDAGFLYNANAVNDDFASFYASWDTIYTFEKRSVDAKGQGLCDVEIINFGLDEEGYLVVYATMYLNFFEDMGNGTQIFLMSAFSQIAGGVTGIIADMYETEDNFVLPVYTTYEQTDPEYQNHGFGLIEYTARYPWLYGNENGDLTPVYSIVMVNYSDDEYSATIDALVAKGYEDLERQPNDKFIVFKLADGDKGSYVIEIGDTTALQLTDGSSIPARSFTYSYEMAETPSGQE